MTGDADHVLIARFRRGDARAFEALYVRYRDRLYGYVLSIVGRAAAAEDIVQEIFSRFFERIEQLSQDGAFRTFMYTTAHNRAIDHLRRHANRTTTLPDTIPLEASDPSRAAIDVEGIDQVRYQIAQLPTEQRSVLLLKVYEGMTFEEIAAVLGEARGTIVSRYTYALDKLRRALSPALVEGDAA